MELQAWIWFIERRFEGAKCDALCAADTFETIGAAGDLGRCRALLRDIEGEMKKLVTSGEFLETVLPPTPINSPLSARVSPQTSSSAND